MSYAFRGTFAHPVQKGETLRLEGDWRENLKEGRIFEVFSMERCPPASRDGEVRFLAERVKGLSRAKAKDLLEVVGGLAALTDMCLNQPEKLDQHLPRAKTTRARVVEAIRDSQEIDRDVMVALQSAEITGRQVRQLVRFFGAIALRQVAQTTPYDLCQVPGVGFSSADRVARFYATARGDDFDEMGEDRLVYGLSDAASRDRAGGHTCMPESRLLRLASKHLNLPATRAARERLDAALAVALARRLLVREYDMIYTRGMRRAESDVSLRFGKMLAGGQAPLSLDAAGVRSELEGSGLSAEQKEAVALVATHPLSLLVGGPGRGKTRTLRSVVDLLEKHKRTYLLLAPTGKAAMRLQEMTGRACQTIHKACGLDHEDDQQARESREKVERVRRKFEVDVVVVEESGMLDLVLCLELLRRIRTGKTALVLVGDPDQIPPVSAGQVLFDLLRSRAVPTARLTQVFRQAQDSQVIQGADAVLAGTTPPFASSGYDLRWFDPASAKNHPGPSLAPESRAAFESATLVSWLKQAMERWTRDLTLDPMTDIQVFAPQRSGALGIDALNKALQEALNPGAGHPRARAGREIKIEGGFAVRVGDKVIQTKNRYRAHLIERDPGAPEPAEGQPDNQAAVMNGAVGRVECMDLEAGTLDVRFGGVGLVRYSSSDEWRRLAPAYAISVHRSQGSEVRFAFLVLHDTMNPRLLTRNLVYTAVTRAKEGVAFFSPRPALLHAIENAESGKRDSNLHRRMMAHAAQQMDLLGEAAPAPPPPTDARRISVDLSLFADAA